MSKTSLLILTSSYPREPGSPAGNFIHEMILHLSPAGFRPFVLSPHYPGIPKREYWPPVKIFRFPYFFPERYELLAYGSGMLYNIRKNPLLVITIPFFMASEFIFSRALIKKYRIGLIHSHWLLPQGLIGSLFRRFMKIPHVATIHGSDLSFIRNHPSLYPLCRFIVQNTDRITVNSSFMQRQLTDIAPVKSGQISVIPMGIDTELFSPHPDPVTRPLFNGKRIILVVGRLVDMKGIVFLIDALPEVLTHFPGTDLVVIGSGPEYGALIQRARDIGLLDHVRFVGLVGHKELPAFYRSANVFVLPSINKGGVTEALGVVLLEAMACGCPVIGSDVGGIPDIITDGENGFLVPEQDPKALAEKILLVFSDDGLRKKLVQKGMDRVHESFSWEKISERFTGVYLQALEMAIDT